MLYGENKMNMLDLVNTGIVAFIEVIIGEIYKWSGSW